MIVLMEIYAYVSGGCNEMQCFLYYDMLEFYLNSSFSIRDVQCCYVSLVRECSSCLEMLHNTVMHVGCFMMLAVAAAHSREIRNIYIYI